MEDIIIFPGCGSNIIYILGNLYKQLLYDKQLLKNVKYYFGVSSGGILCLCLSMGMTIKEIFLFIYNNNIMPQNNTSILSIEFFMNKIRDIFIEKHIDINITMKEFSEKFSKELFFFSYNVNQRKECLLSSFHTPNVPVLCALKSSCSIPIIFDPTIINEEIYIDGVFFNYLPTQILIKYPIKKLLQKKDINCIKIFSFKDFYTEDDEFILNSIDCEKKFFWTEINDLKGFFLTKKTIRKMFVEGFVDKELSNFETIFFTLKEIMNNEII